MLFGKHEYVLKSYHLVLRVIFFRDNLLKMQKMHLFYSVVLLMCLLSEASAQSNTFGISPGIRFFDYAEYGDDGSFLDGEKGPVLGLGGVFEHHARKDVSVLIFGDVFAGTVDYDGRLQSGFPLTTDTDELFYSLGIGVKSPLLLLNSQTNVFFDLVYQVWERDILPTSISTRLFEIYKWWELSLGVEYFLVEVNDNTLSIFGRAYQVINPTMQVDLVSDGYGKPTLDLGEHFGGELGFHWMTSYSPRQQIGFLGTYKFWRFGRSDDMTVIRDDNSAAIVIHEPRSETNNLTLQIIFKSEF